jgi:hypothetical protein
MRAAGFLLLMLGFGLRLDTTWQWTAWALLAVGAGVAIAGLVQGKPDAFVPEAGRE